jgi:hypothetical protein
VCPVGPVLPYSVLLMMDRAYRLISFWASSYSDTLTVLHCSQHSNCGLCVSAVCCELATVINAAVDGLQREEFPTRLEELRPQLQGLVTMCDKLINNSSLRAFLTQILQIGNCVNAVSVHLRWSWWYCCLLMRKRLTLAVEVQRGSDHWVFVTGNWRIDSELKLGCFLCVQVTAAVFCIVRAVHKLRFCYKQNAT